MARITPLSPLVVLGALAIAAPAAPQRATAPGAPSYTVVDLGSLGGPNAQAHALNAHGQVAGDAVNAAGQSHACLHDGSRLADLGLSGALSVARGVNAAGQVTGFVYDHGYQAYLWARGKARLLGTLGGNYSSGFAVSGRGHVCGSSFTGAGREHAFLWSDGHMADLGTLGGSSSAARAINTQDQVAGFASLANGATHAFLWSAGTMHDLGTLGGSSSTAYAISDGGVVAGAACLGGKGGMHAARWAGGAVQDLGALGPGASQALGISPDGATIVGTSQVAGPGGVPRYHAFVWRAGTMQDLNALVPAGTDWLLEQADAVNDAGQIVGYGVRGGTVHAFLLAPTGGAALAARSDAARVDAGPPLPLRLWNQGANPAMAPTVLAFTLPAPGSAALTVYDVAGRRVRDLTRGTLAAGAHTLRWDLADEGGRRVAAGAYFVRLVHGGETRDLRLVVLR